MVYKRFVGIFPYSLLYIPPNKDKEIITSVNKIDDYVYSWRNKNDKRVIVKIHRIYNKTTNFEYTPLFLYRDFVVFRTEPDKNIDGDEIEFEYSYINSYEYVLPKFYLKKGSQNMMQEFNTLTNEGLKIIISLSENQLKYKKYSNPVQIYFISKRFNKLLVYKLNFQNFEDEIYSLSQSNNLIEIVSNGIGTKIFDENSLKNTKYLYDLNKIENCLDNQTCNIELIGEYDISKVKELKISNLDFILNLEFEIRNSSDDLHFTFDKITEGFTLQFITINDPLQTSLLLKGGD